MHRLPSPLRQKAALLLTLCMLLGARGRRGGPAHMFEFETVHPDYPRSAAFCGLGTDEESLSQAMQNARVEVSRQINSQIQGQLTHAMTVISSEGQTSAEQFAESLTIEETRFEHAELIRTVDTLEPGRRNNLYRAYVCLGRIPAARTMLEDLGPVRHRFSMAHQAGLETSSAGNIAAFTNQYRVAMELAPTFIKNYAMLQIIDANSARELQPALEKLSELRAIAAGIRRGARISVVAHPSAGNQRSNMANVFRQAVESFGLDATGSGSTCRSGGFTHLLRVKVTPECNRGHMAMVCKLAFSVELENCRQRDSASALIEENGLRGSHNQFREETATARAWAKLAPGLVREPLKILFQSQLPLD